MINQRVGFTKAGLSQLLDQKGGRTVVHDPRTPGLQAELRSGGQVTFYVFKRRPGGGPVRVRVGPFPTLTVEQARKQAQQILADIAKGLDPNANRRKAKSEPTLDDLWNAWHEGHARVHKRASSCREDERQYRTLLESFRTRKLMSISTTDVAAWHRSVGERHGRFAANRALSLLSAMFSQSGVLLSWSGANPTKGIRRFTESSRDRFLLPDELPKFFDALDAEPDPWPDYFRVALLTGARRANLVAMSWPDIDLTTRIWRIPAEQSKSGDPIVLPLADEVVAILQRRQKASTGQWVFPSRGATGHVLEIKSAWKRIVNRAGIANLRPHDLRRTLGSWQAGAGVSLTVIGKSLGHRAGSTATAVYSRLSLDPVRAAVEAAAQAMARAAKCEGQKNG